MYKLIRAELGAEFIANIVFRKSINLINFIYTFNIIYISIIYKEHNYYRYFIQVNQALDNNL
jgi:hypothetical protein